LEEGLKTCKGYHRGNTVLDYRETLPEDFSPVVILDASGRVDLMDFGEVGNEDRSPILHFLEINEQCLNGFSKGGMTTPKRGEQMADVVPVQCQGLSGQNGFISYAD
jgi:hypothetical protein